MTHLFISYSRSDHDFAQKLTDTLRDNGVEVFLDVQAIDAGEKWSTAIQRALDAADVMLLIVSPASMESPNVEDEWQYFLDNKKPIIPVLWLPAKLHFQLNRLQYVNFNGVAFETALANLFAELNKKGVQVSAATPQSTPAPPPVSKRASLEFARLPHVIEPNAKLKKSDELFGGPAALPTTKAIKKGEAVEILGRTPNSEWLHLKTTDGQQGWLPRGVIGLMVDINTIPITADNPSEQQVDFIVPRRLLYGLITVAMVVVIGTAIYFSGLLPDGDEDKGNSNPLAGLGTSGMLVAEMVDTKSGNAGLELRDMETNQTRRIALGADTKDSDPLWSPDGSRFSFIRESLDREVLYLADPTGKELQDIFVGNDANITEVQWSPDGQSIAFSVEYDGPNELRVYNRGNFQTNAVSFPDDTRRITGFAWSPDSRQLAYAWWEYRDNAAIQLWELLTDSKREWLTLTSNSIGELVWIDTDTVLFGARIMQSGTSDFNTYEHIYSANIADTQFHEIGNADGLPLDDFALSPDGQSLAYIEWWETGTRHLEVLNVTSGTERREFDEGLLEFEEGQSSRVTHSIWSPDGKYLAFAVVARPSNENEPTFLYLYIAPKDTLKPIRVAQIADERSFTWSPDGKYLLYLQSTSLSDTEVKFDLYLALADDPSNTRRVTNLPQFLTDGSGEGFLVPVAFDWQPLARE